jgi:FG-GAP repeat/PKD domain/Bacterial Ig domain
MKFLKWTFLLSLLMVLLTAGRCGSGPINGAPTVNAGVDQSVLINTSVTLTSTASDPEGLPLSYKWAITSKPKNSQSTLTNSSKAVSSFTPDVAGTYEFSITVSDGQDEVSDVVIVLAKANDPLNQPPVVNVAADQDSFVGNVVTLTATASDPEGKPLSYIWTFSSKPSGSLSQLSNANQAVSSFIPDIPGSYQLLLTVSDGQDSTSDSLVVTAASKDPQNTAPTAKAGIDQNVNVGQSVILNGDGSTDLDGDTLTFAWSFVSKPPSSTTTLQTTSNQQSGFVPDVAGDYVVALDVSDAQETTRDTLTVTAKAPGNVAPQLSAITAQQALIDVPFDVPFSFTDETPATVSIVASSSNQTLVPDANLVLSGTGATRTLSIVPLLAEGTLTINLLATDAQGLTNASSFSLIIAKPFATSTQLLSPNPKAGDLFGYSVAITDTYALVGAYQADNKGSNSGAAYVYKRSGDTWQYVQTLTASNGAASDNFGQSLILTDTLAIVTARSGDGLATDTGAVYIYQRSGETWSEVQKLSSDDGVAGDEFGFSVALLGNSIFIGADEDDNKGSAYIFQKQGSSYVQTQKLQPATLDANHRFGRSVAVFGTTLMLGAAGDDTNGDGAGAVYVYQNNGAGWSQVDILTASDGSAGDRFGRAIEFDDRYAVISAVYDDALGSFAGSAYIFELKNGIWTQMQKLEGSDTDLEDRFGHSALLNGDYVMIGAYEAGATGALYVYKHMGNTWNQVNRLKPAQVVTGDFLGEYSKMTSNYIISGARNHDAGATNAGAVYIFKKQ